MKKVFLFLAFLSSLSLSAQQYELTGKVVDKKTGTPIHGAEVTSLGVYKAETDYDGSFTLNSMVPLKSVKVTAPGKNSKSQKAENGMTVEMQTQTMWNAKPEKWSPFVTLEFMIPKHNELSLGLMAGYIKKHGFYVKALFSPAKETQNKQYYFSSSSSNSGLIGQYTGSYKYSVSSYGAGYMYNIIKPLYAYAGAGYMTRKLAFERIDGDYDEIETYTNTDYFAEDSQGSGPYVELGLMGAYRKFLLNAGCSLIIPGHPADCAVSPHIHIGVGYMF